MAVLGRKIFYVAGGPFSSRTTQDKHSPQQARNQSDGGEKSVLIPAESFPLPQSFWAVANHTDPENDKYEKDNLHDDENDDNVKYHQDDDDEEVVVSDDWPLGHRYSPTP